MDHGRDRSRVPGGGARHVLGPGRRRRPCGVAGAREGPRLAASREGLSGWTPRAKRHSRRSARGISTGTRSCPPAKRAGCRWYIIEQDSDWEAGDPFESLKLSLAYPEEDVRRMRTARARASARDARAAVKVKATPADFMVQEESSLVLSPQRSDYAVFRLLKSSWDTFDLIDLLARRLGRPRRRHQRRRHEGPARQHRAAHLRARAAPARPDPSARRTSASRSRAGRTAPSPPATSAATVSPSRCAISTQREAEIMAAECTRGRARRHPQLFRRAAVRLRAPWRRLHGQGDLPGQAGEGAAALLHPLQARRPEDPQAQALRHRELGRAGGSARAWGSASTAASWPTLPPTAGAYHQALERIEKRFLVFVLNAYQSFLFNEVLARWLAEVAADGASALAPLRYSRGTFLFPRRPARRRARGSCARTRFPFPATTRVCADARVQADPRRRPGGGRHSASPT